MFCQNCGKEMPNDSLFCPECGIKQEPDVVVQKSMQNEPRKYCSNCGIQIPLDSRFCPECRTRQDDVAGVPKIQPRSQNSVRPQKVPVTNLSPEEQTKIKKRNKIIGISFAAAIVLCVTIGVLSSLIKPSINLNKYLKVTFEGYDTVGKAVVTFDNEQFEKDYEKKLSASSGKKASGIFLYNCVNGSIDRNSGLSNGDVVTYSWECNDEYALETYGCKLKYKDVECKVEGLEEAEVFDPFEGIAVVFSGISPSGSANIEGEPTARAAQDLRYELDNYNGLSNGDKVTVTVSTYYDNPVEYCIENYGMLPTPLTKEYKVEGLDRYIQAISDISTDALSDMQKQAEDVYNAHVAQNWGDDETLRNFTYIGSYLLTNKKQDDYWGVHNVLYLVYRAQVNDKYSNDSGKYDKTNDIYWYICYYDLLVDSDGVTTVDITNYKTPGDRFTIDSGISSGWWSTKTWYYYGYQTLDELYKVVVTSNSESYKHEDNVDENLITAETEETEENEEDEVMGEEGIIFPNSSDELIDESDISILSDEELRYAINELYAKHGYIFKDDQLKAYYEKYEWYDPSVKPDDFSVDLFNDVEKENIEAMQKERDSRK